MKILFVASECAPIIKVGGLADVIGALPKALNSLKADVSIALPFYDKIQILENKPASKEGDYCSTPPTAGENCFSVFQTKLPGTEISVYLFKNLEFLSDGPYDSPSAVGHSEKEERRFRFFNYAVFEWQKTHQYDIIHCHDKHAALLCKLLKTRIRENPLPIGVNPHSVLTIHNLANKGSRATGLSVGIEFADFLTTVSPHYALEIQTPEFGEGLEMMLQTRAREGKLIGILNGLDTEYWNPVTDSFLEYKLALKMKEAQVSETNVTQETGVKRQVRKQEYGDQNEDTEILPLVSHPVSRLSSPASNAVSITSNPPIISDFKGKNKKSLLDHLGLDLDPNIPLFSFVGRLDEQKGFDILIPAWQKFCHQHHAHLVILGTGDPDYAQALTNQEVDIDLFFGRPEVTFVDRFNEKLAHQIYAGADFFLMPSRFEPCGLTQMIAMRYGTIPIVHDVGGLHDSVSDGEDGLVFKRYTADALLEAMERAIKLDNLSQYRENALSRDFSWHDSAIRYFEIYRQLVSKKLIN